MVCKFCEKDKEQEIIICNDCYEELKKLGLRGAFSDKADLIIQIELLREEIDEIKNLLNSFKIRGFRLKSIKNKLKN